MRACPLRSLRSPLLLAALWVLAAVGSTEAQANLKVVGTPEIQSHLQKAGSPSAQDVVDSLSLLSSKPEAHFKVERQNVNVEAASNTLKIRRTFSEISRCTASITRTISNTLTTYVNLSRGNKLHSITETQFIESSHFTHIKPIKVTEILRTQVTRHTVVTENDAFFRTITSPENQLGNKNAQKKVGDTSVTIISFVTDTVTETINRVTSSNIYFTTTTKILSPQTVYETVDKTIQLTYTDTIVPPPIVMTVNEENSHRTNAVTPSKATGQNWHPDVHRVKTVVMTLSEIKTITTWMTRTTGIPRLYSTSHVVINYISTAPPVTTSIFNTWFSTVFSTFPSNVNSACAGLSGSSCVFN